LANTASTSRVFSSAGIFVRRDRTIITTCQLRPRLSTTRDPVKKYESVEWRSIEHMFDSEFAAASDEEVVAAIEDGARQEAIGGARRLAAVAELTRRRVVDDDERVMWAFDPWDSAAAEVAAALHIGHRRASGQMRIAQALRDRLPQVAALLLEGRDQQPGGIGDHLGHPPGRRRARLALIDTAITDRATRWDPLSEDKTSSGRRHSGQPA
jgi:hypothetical protein